MASTCLVFVVKSVFLLAQPDSLEWRYSKTVDDVKVFTRKTNRTDIKEIRAEGVFKAPIRDVINIMTDFENASDWSYKTRSSSLLEHPKDSVWIAHYIVSTPWPLADRDLINKTTLIKLDSGGYKLLAESVSDYLPVQDKLVRMKIADGFWQFKSISKSETYAIYEYVADPEGIPSWMVNLMADEAPVVTFKNIRKELKAN